MFHYKTKAENETSIFDLETTGVNPGKNGIHQISGEIVIDGVSKEQFDFHVQPNPKAIIEEEALKVAGVTREQVLAYPPMRQVYSEFVAMLGKYVDKYNKKDKFFWLATTTRLLTISFARFLLTEQRQLLWVLVLVEYH